jgi:hypothetical protein
MTMAMTEAGYAAKEAPATFVGAIENVHEQVASISSRLTDLTDRLCGSTPQPPEQAGRALNAVPNGIFDNLSERATDMSTKLDRMRDCLNRIERALP